MSACVASSRATLPIMRELIPTSLGDARITRFPAEGRRHATLLLGHGAGGGIEAADLQALAVALPAEGVEVGLIEQPWRVAGKRLAPAPKTLDAGWRETLEQIRTSGHGHGHGHGGPAGPGTVPLIVGGRSAGARVACRTGRETGAAGVLALAFPLHPPGKPEKSRAGELLGAGVPTLVVQGGNDPFGKPAEFPESPLYELVEVPYGDHGFAVPKRAPVGQDEALGTITDAVAAWARSLA